MRKERFRSFLIVIPATAGIHASTCALDQDGPPLEFTLGPAYGRTRARG
jgi:hypothetical protein